MKNVVLLVLVLSLFLGFTNLAFAQEKKEEPKKESILERLKQLEVLKKLVDELQKENKDLKDRLEKIETRTSLIDVKTLSFPTSKVENECFIDLKPLEGGQPIFWDIWVCSDAYFHAVYAKIKAVNTHNAIPVFTMEILPNPTNGEIKLEQALRGITCKISNSSNESKIGSVKVIIVRYQFK